MIRIFDTQIPALGMGCWPIGGTMYHGTQSLGYAKADDGASIRTIHAAWDGGIRVYDTAAAYGAGHSERLLAQALKGRPDALIITKIGIGIDEQSKQISFQPFKPEDVVPAVEGCLRRLNRECLDLVLLHINDMPVAEAQTIFHAMDGLRAAGKLRAYGWSTDYSERASAVASQPNFVAVEYAMNLFFDAPRMQNVARDQGLLSLIRSPLAMGLLSGKYNAATTLPANDIRASREDWMEYYRDGRANPAFLETLAAVRDLLTQGGRTPVQGALAWIWGQREDHVPVPGARTAEQMNEITDALSLGPLPAETMEQIETLITRNPNEPDQPR